ncbi:glycosyltransferase family 4 protein [Methanocella arvoryzae]|nr:glycosyltransferase [Methanocella arvoryzae]
MVDRRLVFATFFPGCENIHLTKDVGMIPYVLYKNHGYDSYLISYRNGDYPYLQTEVPGLRLIFLKKGPWHLLREWTLAIFKKGLIVRGIEALCTALDALPVMLRMGRMIDVLQLYHLKDESIVIGWIYRLVNPRGKLYLKLDISSEVVEEFERRGKDGTRSSRIYESLSFDLITAETRHAVKVLTENHLYYKHKNVCYIPNGTSVKTLETFRREVAKERIVLHVGRLGNPQKGTDIALEAFSRVAAEFPAWKLVLVGPVESYFPGELEDFFVRHPELRSRVDCVGFLEHREQVFDYYQRAKILLMPSRFEGFSLASLEAAYFGDVILGSDIPSIKELTDYGKLGYLCPVKDIECFAQKLGYMMSHEGEIEDKSAANASFVIDNYDWKVICGTLDRLIRETIAGKGKSG